MKNRVIPLVLVPIFALAACSNEEPARVAVPSEPEQVVQNADGSYSTNPLLDSYQQAKAQGYTGTLDEWAQLSKLYETNPQQAQEVAQQSGFSGGDMFLGALAGAAVGALAANAMSSKTNMASNTYSAQRVNDRTNYAYSQPADRERDRRTTGSGYVPGAGTSATANRTASGLSSSTTAPKAATTAPRPSVSAPARSTTSFTSVSRGGFGGAVSSGG